MADYKFTQTGAQIQTLLNKVPDIDDILDGTKKAKTAENAEKTIAYDTYDVKSNSSDGVTVSFADYVLTAVAINIAFRNEAETHIVSFGNIPLGAIDTASWTYINYNENGNLYLKALRSSANSTISIKGYTKQGSNAEVQVVDGTFYTNLIS